MTAEYQYLKATALRVSPLAPAFICSLVAGIKETERTSSRAMDYRSM